MLFVGYALRHGGHFMKHRAKRKKHKPKGHHRKSSGKHHRKPPPYHSRAPPFSVLNIQKISIRGNKKCVQKNFFNFFSFSSCQNGDFCTTYMKGKTEHHFRKRGRR